MSSLAAAEQHRISLGTHASKRQQVTSDEASDTAGHQTKDWQEELVQQEASLISSSTPVPVGCSKTTVSEREAGQQ
jgi:hypothetical protein